MNKPFKTHILHHSFETGVRINKYLLDYFSTEHSNIKYLMLNIHLPFSFLLSAK